MAARDSTLSNWHATPRLSTHPFVCKTNFSRVMAQKYFLRSSPVVMDRWRFATGVSDAPVEIIILATEVLFLRVCGIFVLFTQFLRCGAIKSIYEKTRVLKKCSFVGILQDPTSYRMCGVGLENKRVCILLHAPLHIYIYTRTMFLSTPQ